MRISEMANITTGVIPPAPALPEGGLRLGPPPTHLARLNACPSGGGSAPLAAATPTRVESLTTAAAAEAVRPAATPLQELIQTDHRNLNSHRVVRQKAVLALASMASSSVAATPKDIRVKYEMTDIGTLQTKESRPIAINNAGQILGWYNLDGTPAGKHFFVRDRDGTFHEIQKTNGWEIDWQYLKNDGRAYGIYKGQGQFGALCVWDKKSGMSVVGNLPGQQIKVINDIGQVLIMQMAYTDSAGAPVKGPVIWHNGQVTKLRRPYGNLSLESTDIYGMDMNNNGEVVGYAVLDMVYKDKVYKQTRAMYWNSDAVIDLHKMMPKLDNTQALWIVDSGYIVNNQGYCISLKHPEHLENISQLQRANNMFVCHSFSLYSPLKNTKTISDMTEMYNLVADHDSIWSSHPNTYNGIYIANDLGEAVATAQTVYGETHIVLLRPKEPIKF